MNEVREWEIEQSSIREDCANLLKHKHVKLE